MLRADLHVWIVDNPRGAFADLENSSSVRGSAAGKGGALAARLQGALGGGSVGTSASPGTVDCSAHSHRG